MQCRTSPLRPTRAHTNHKAVLQPSFTLVHSWGPERPPTHQPARLAYECYDAAPPCMSAVTVCQPSACTARSHQLTTQAPPVRRGSRDCAAAPAALGAMGIPLALLAAPDGFWISAGAAGMTPPPATDAPPSLLTAPPRAERAPSTCAPTCCAGCWEADGEITPVV